VGKLIASPTEWEVADTLGYAETRVCEGLSVGREYTKCSLHAEKSPELVESEYK
jgi:hypothetical protein